MRLPALTVEEQAFFAATRSLSRPPQVVRAEPPLLNCLAGRVRGSLTACLGVPVQIAHAGIIRLCGSGMGNLPRIVPDEEMTNAWIDARFGGHPGTGKRRICGGPRESLLITLKRALAESVVNSGGLEWPTAIGLQMRIKHVPCGVEFFIDPGNLMKWAKAELEKAP